VIAFSPKIHHAVSFAAKHHEGQRRKGRDTPYITHPFQVALILTRYGRPEDEVVAALVHDVVEDCATEETSRAELRRKIAEKFGERVSNIVHYVTEEKVDRMGASIDVAIRRERYLDKLQYGPDGAHWVCAADKVHNGSSLLLDLLHAADRDAVWGAFSGGKPTVCAWYRAVHERLRELGFDGAIMSELHQVASLIEFAAITNSADLPTR
jgi:(p)ppGpp synthase/HD superfamily hydrolase